MVTLREHEADAQAVDAAGNLHWRQVQVNPGRLEQVGTATFARDCAVAVFGHFAASRGEHKRRRRGHVEDVRTVTAGTDHVDHAVEAFQLDLVCQLTHHRDRADDFVDALALHAHAHQEGTDLRLAALAGHDLAHDVAHFCSRQVQVANDTAQRAFDIHARILNGGRRSA